jgi:hypothetical protein
MPLSPFREAVRLEPDSPERTELGNALAPLDHDEAIDHLRRAATRRSRWAGALRSGHSPRSRQFTGAVDGFERRQLRRPVEAHINLGMRRPTGKADEAIESSKAPGLRPDFEDANVTRAFRLRRSCRKEVESARQKVRRPAPS